MLFCLSRLIQYVDTFFTLSFFNKSFPKRRINKPIGVTTHIISEVADAGLLIVDLTDMTGTTYWHLKDFRKLVFKKDIFFKIVFSLYFVVYHVLSNMLMYFFFYSFLINRYLRDA